MRRRRTASVYGAMPRLVRGADTLAALDYCRPVFAADEEGPAVAKQDRCVLHPRHLQRARAAIDVFGGVEDLQVVPRQETAAAGDQHVAVAEDERFGTERRSPFRRGGLENRGAGVKELGDAVDERRIVDAQKQDIPV